MASDFRHVAKEEELYVIDFVKTSAKLVSFVIFYSPGQLVGCPGATLVASFALLAIQLSKNLRMGAGPRLNSLFGGGTKSEWRRFAVRA